MKRRVVHFHSPLLLGQSALKRLGKYTIGLTIAQSLNYAIEKHNLEGCSSFDLDQHIKRIEQLTGQTIGYKAESPNT